MRTELDRAVVWHDLECGNYRADLPLWRMLGDQYGDPILDVGAGTGRVTLALARAGKPVTALDVDALLLEELERRAAGLPVATAVADARGFEVGARFALIIVPMQTIQLLGGAEGRGAFLRRARNHLRPGGRVAVALTERFDLYHPEPGQPPLMPDVLHRNGITYSSRPVAVRVQDDRILLERRREVSAPGEHQRPWAEDDCVHMDRLTAEQLEAEALGYGLRAAGRASVPSTPEHVGSVVVMLGG